MILRPTYLLFVVLLGAAISAQARFAMVEVKQVPLARLIDNLAASARVHPEQPQYRLNLARAYTMAFALNSDQGRLSVKEQGHDSLDFAPTYTLDYKAVMPSKVGVAPGGAARNFLAEAIKLYERLARENGADPYLGPLARLGYAWSSEQNGDKQVAKAGYRVLVNEVHADPYAPTAVPVPGRDWWDASAEAAGQRA